MIQFTDDCLMGVEQLDEEHRHLFDLLGRGMYMLHNEYSGDQYSAIKALLEELEEYAERHFVHEEQYMEQLRDPELILQRSQHMFFKERILEFLVKNIDDEDNWQRYPDWQAAAVGRVDDTGKSVRIYRRIPDGD